MITLYPTETTYAFGVDVFDPKALEALYELKGRDVAKAVSWLVPDVAAIEKYAVMSDKAHILAKRFLPGPLTLILPARNTVPQYAIHEDGTIGFRISSDPIAMKLAKESEHPLTATSANVSGLPTLPTPAEVVAQCGVRASLIDHVIDDGPRSGTPSTVVQCVGDGFEVLRIGTITLD